MYLDYEDIAVLYLSCKTLDSIALLNVNFIENKIRYKSVLFCELPLY